MPEHDSHQHGVHARQVAYTIAGIGLVVVVVCAAAFGLVRVWGTPSAGANAPMDIPIPGPRLQSAPRQESAMEVEQHVGAQLPLDARFVDEDGRETTLSRLAGKRPLVLVFGYYQCPNVCTSLMEGVLLGASAMDLAPDAYGIVSIGIDPRETAQDAAQKARAYGIVFEGMPLHLLTGTAAESARVAAAAGVHYAYDAVHQQYSHPLAVLVVTPEGRISRYFADMQIDPGALKLALVEASNGRIGSLTDRIFLTCAHFDPKTGRYSFAAMSFVRAGCLLVAVALGWWIWRRRRR